ncbi:hypothetical protein FA95DRAFT_1558353 [Auriscalpium vulgare]|uniref:Uncharacterized protein n=1 Tax=Auriscalpium vulgare TaxID=40419 RepID=A0ACB8RXD2_9AGAM|nr:hypothetical protein FA95DRAFT_1558353 [Auriscalpium vulgare]
MRRGNGGVVPDAVGSRAVSVRRQNGCTGRGDVYGIRRIGNWDGFWRRLRAQTSG